MRKMPVLCLMLAVVASACGSAPGSGKQGKALAVVNGEPLTEATLLKEVENLPPYVRPILETAAGRAQFLESIITRDLLMREALRRGIDRRPEVADRIAMARKSIVLEALLRDVAEKAPGLSDAALRKIYDADPAAYQVGERVKVSHMLFREKARALEMLGRAKAGELAGRVFQRPVGRTSSPSRARRSTHPSRRCGSRRWPPVPRWSCRQPCSGAAVRMPSGSDGRQSARRRLRG